MNTAPHSDLRVYVNLLARYVRPYWRQATLLTVLLLGSIGLSLVSPRIIAGFIDQAKNQAALSALTRAALTYLIIGLNRIEKARHIDFGDAVIRHR